MKQFSMREENLPKGALQELKEWYLRAARPLPWRRKVPNPYEIWISEVMSQQSTMKTVVPYFERWVKAFPTLEALAKADEQEVLKMWAGLGYYSRARNVLKGAQTLAALRSVPSTWTEWLEIPGVGPYTAKAVAAIAFSQPVLPVDGNVIRVFSRLFAVKDPLNVSSERSKLDEILARVEKQIDPADAGLFAQAFMELGSSVCRPGALAECGRCPLKSACRVEKKGQSALYPAKKKRKETLRQSLLVHLVSKKGPEFLAVQIAEGQRLAGQWEFPLEELPGDAKMKGLLGPVRHTITHHQYEVYAKLAPATPKSLIKGRKSRFLNTKNPENRLLLTTLSRKILTLYENL